MDKVVIHDLEVFSTVGIWQWEKQMPRKLVLNLELGWDNSRPGMSDDIQDALDYFKVSESIKSLCKNADYNLIESLAEEIALVLQDDFGVAWCKIELLKPGALSNVSNVGVVIERGNKS